MFGAVIKILHHNILVVVNLCEVREETTLDIFKSGFVSVYYFYCGDVVHIRTVDRPAQVRRRLSVVLRVLAAEVPPTVPLSRWQTP